MILTQSIAYMITIGTYMNKLIIIIVFLLAYIVSNGQNTLFGTSNENYGFKGVFLADDNPYPVDSLDTEIARVYYDFTYRGEKEITGMWLLQVGINTTRFLPECRYQADSIYRSSNGARLFSYYAKGDPFHFYDSFYITKDKCKFTSRLAADDIFYEESIPSISWELLDSETYICDHLCKEATGYFRGRTYRVFYTEDIPVSSGPWKLTGLPGFILHADVDGGKFILRAKQILPSTGAPILWTKYPYVQVSRKQYMSMLSQMQQHYFTYFNSHLGRSNVIVRSGKNHIYLDLSWVEQLEIE